MTQFAKRMEIFEPEVDKLKVLTSSLISPNIVSFAGGAPAKEAYPFETLNEIAREVFQDTPEGMDAVKYGSAEGYLPLREAVCDCLLAPRGVYQKPENIMITAGGIQGMNLLAQLFIDPGDVILVETPSFIHATMIFKLFGAKFVPCAMDDNGMVISDVEEKIRQYHPKFVYTVPTFQNPTGVTMCTERRKQLAELGGKYDVIILEDDAYREIRYSGEHLPYIKSFDTDGHVILSNSFSKIFSPGSRLGYIAADDSIIQKLVGIKLGTDTCTGEFSQVIAAEFFKRGLYPKHLEHLCSIYRSRRDAMTETIDKYFPEGTKRTSPDGGYYVWVELPEGLSATKCRGEILSKLKIAFGDGSIFFTEGNPEGAGENCMRLNFSGPDEETIREHLKNLGEYFCEKMKEA